MIYYFLIFSLGFFLGQIRGYNDRKLEESERIKKAGC